MSENPPTTQRIATGDVQPDPVRLHMDVDGKTKPWSLVNKDLPDTPSVRIVADMNKVRELNAINTFGNVTITLSTKKSPEARYFSLEENNEGKLVLHKVDRKAVFENLGQEGRSGRSIELTQLLTDETNKSLFNADLIEVQALGAKNTPESTPLKELPRSRPDVRFEGPTGPSQNWRDKKPDLSRSGETPPQVVNQEGTPAWVEQQAKTLEERQVASEKAAVEVAQRHGGGIGETVRYSPGKLPTQEDLQRQRQEEEQEAFEQNALRESQAAGRGIHTVPVDQQSGSLVDRMRLFLGIKDKTPDQVRRQIADNKAFTKHAFGQSKTKGPVSGYDIRTDFGPVQTEQPTDTAPTSIPSEQKK